MPAALNLLLELAVKGAAERNEMEALAVCVINFPSALGRRNGLNGYLTG